LFEKFEDCGFSATAIWNSETLKQREARETRNQKLEIRNKPHRPLLMR